MFKKIASLGSGIRRFFKKIGTYDHLLAFRELIAYRQRGFTALKQLLPRFVTGKEAFRKIPRSYLPQVEMLENRQLLTTSTWTGGGSDDNWSTGANWNNGVPG